MEKKNGLRSDILWGGGFSKMIYYKFLAQLQSTYITYLLMTC